MAEIKQIAMIGTGSMGSMMSLLFAEHGIIVSAFDPKEDNLNKCIENAKEAGLGDKVKPYKDYQSLCDSLSHPKVFILSIPHGSVGDSIVESLNDYIDRRDLVVDFSNEHYAATQRRQAKLMARGVSYIGSGVSGGYQSARAGPSISPSGDDRALDMVMPLLEKVAAKDKNGNPCVKKMGPGGSGHYVKMIHNGIEQGMMSTLCEAWSLMHKGLGMSYGEIADVWEKWTKEGELADNFLIDIGIDICRTRDPEGGKPVLDEIKDKVVQDVDETEGTGVWTCEEAMRLHEPIPTIAAAHQFRLGSASSTHRVAVAKSAGGPLSKVSKINTDRESFLEDVRLAVYAGYLSAFVQGLTLCATASNEQKWDIDFADVINIWRAGCIIRSGSISDLLTKAYKEGGKEVRDYPLKSGLVARELKKSYAPLKKVVVLANEADATVPSLAATLEYLKYSTTDDELPTEFMEAELDYFGHHNFDLRNADSGKPVTGEHHFGWKPAKDVPEPRKVV